VVVPYPFAAASRPDEPKSAAGAHEGIEVESCPIAQPSSIPRDAPA
jgi:hypothetical protein